MSLFGTRRTDAAALLPLHPQPAALSWPTVEWPRAELDPKVDREALMRLLDDAFSEPPPDSLERTHATVIIHRGAIVAEQYASESGFRVPLFRGSSPGAAEFGVIRVD